MNKLLILIFTTIFLAGCSSIDNNNINLSSLRINQDSIRKFDPNLKENSVTITARENKTDVNYNVKVSACIDNGIFDLQDLYIWSSIGGTNISTWYLQEGDRLIYVDRSFLRDCIIDRIEMI